MYTTKNKPQKDLENLVNEVKENSEMNLICPECNSKILIKIDPADMTCIYECTKGHILNKSDLLSYNDCPDPKGFDTIGTKLETETKGNRRRSILLLDFPFSTTSFNNENEKKDDDYHCNQHKEKYVSYCMNCCKDLCMICLGDHDSHDVKHYTSIMPKKKYIHLEKQIVLHQKKKIEQLAILINDVIEKIKIELKNMIKLLEDRLEANDIQLKKFDFHRLNYGEISIINNLPNEFNRKIIQFLNEEKESTLYKKGILLCGMLNIEKSDLMYHMEYNRNNLRDSMGSILENEFKFGAGDDISENSNSMIGVSNFTFAKKYAVTGKNANSVKFNVNDDLSANKEANQHKKNSIIKNNQAKSVKKNSNFTKEIADDLESINPRDFSADAKMFDNSKKRNQKSDKNPRSYDNEEDEVQIKPEYPQEDSSKKVKVKFNIQNNFFSYDDNNKLNISNLNESKNKNNSDLKNNENEINNLNNNIIDIDISNDYNKNKKQKRDEMKFKSKISSNIENFKNNEDNNLPKKTGYQVLDKEEKYEITEKELEIENGEKKEKIRNKKIFSIKSNDQLSDNENNNEILSSFKSYRNDNNYTTTYNNNTYEGNYEIIPKFEDDDKNEVDKIFFNYEDNENVFKNNRTNSDKKVMKRKNRDENNDNCNINLMKSLNEKNNKKTDETNYQPTKNKKNKDINYERNTYDNCYSYNYDFNKLSDFVSNEDNEKNKEKGRKKSKKRTSNDYYIYNDNKDNKTYDDNKDNKNIKNFGQIKEKKYILNNAKKINNNNTNRKFSKNHENKFREKNMKIKKSTNNSKKKKNSNTFREDESQSITSTNNASNSIKEKPPRKNEKFLYNKQKNKITEEEKSINKSQMTMDSMIDNEKTIIINESDNNKKVFALCELKKKNILCVGERRGSISLYDTNTFFLLFTIEGKHNKDILHLSELSDGKLLSCGKDCKINIFQFTNYHKDSKKIDGFILIQTITEKDGLTGKVFNCIELSNKLLLSVDSKNAIIWKQSTNNKLYQFYYPINSVSKNIYSILELNSNVFVLYIQGGIIIFYNSKTFEELQKITLPLGSALNSKTFRENLCKLNDEVFVADGNDCLFLISVSKMELIREIYFNDYNCLHSFCSMNDNECILVACSKNKNEYINTELLQYNINDTNDDLILTVIIQSENETRKVLSVLALEKGAIVTGSDDGTVKVWK